MVLLLRIIAAFALAVSFALASTELPAQTPLQTTGSRWILIHGNWSAGSYLDTLTFRELSNGIYEGWVQTRHVEPIETGLGKSKTSLEKVEVDCRNRRVASRAYSDYDSSGELIAAGRSPRKWDDVVPGTDAEIAFWAICAYAERSSFEVFSPEMTVRLADQLGFYMLEDGLANQGPPHGKVTVSFWIAETGQVLRYAVEKSSGNRRVDDLVLDSVRGLWFRPPLDSGGKRIRVVRSIEFTVGSNG